jgi:hypothetical protein
VTDFRSGVAHKHLVGRTRPVQVFQCAGQILIERSWTSRQNLHRRSRPEVAFISDGRSEDHSRSSFTTPLSCPKEFRSLSAGPVQLFQCAGQILIERSWTSRHNLRSRPTRCCTLVGEAPFEARFLRAEFTAPVDLRRSILSSKSTATLLHDSTKSIVDAMEASMMYGCDDADSR